MNGIIQLVDILAVGVFAITGALAAAERKQDILGFILFGTITGIGGGTARDLLLATDTIFWISDTRYLWVCIGASTATWFYLIVQALPGTATLAMPVAISLAFALRASAILFDLCLPKYGR